MNKKEMLMQRNRIARMLTQRSKPHRNKVIISAANGYNHEYQKFRLAWNATVDGEEFYVEAEFPGGRRADFLNLDKNLVVEIADSESEESLKKKEEFYNKRGLKFEVIRL